MKNLMVNLHKCHSGRKESKSWVVRGVQQQGPSHSELGWDGYFFGGFLIHFERSESIWATDFKVFADCYQRMRDKVGYS